MIKHDTAQTLRSLKDQKMHLYRLKDFCAALGTMVDIAARSTLHFVEEWEREQYVLRIKQQRCRQEGS